MTKLVGFTSSDSFATRDAVDSLVHELAPLLPDDVELRAAGMRLAPQQRPDLAVFDPGVFADQSQQPVGCLLLWMGDSDDPAVTDPSVLQPLRAVLRSRGWWPVEVTEHVQSAAGAYDDPGAVLRIGLTKRNPDLTREQFARKWVVDHGSLVLGRQPLYYRYVANVVSDGATSFDGIVEQQFLDMASWQENDRRIREEKADVRQHLRELVGGLVQFAGTDIFVVQVPSR